MASTTSWRRPQRTTSAPASASTMENAVPHDPVPSTATRVMLCPCGWCSCGSPWVVTARTPRVAGHGQTLLLGVEPLGRRLLAADLLEQRGHCGHDALGHLLPQWRGNGGVPRGVEVDGRGMA